MSLTDRAREMIERLLPAEKASAHCDIPCGIYDPNQAQVAALTVIRMVQLIEALAIPTADDQRKAFLNSMGRYVDVKEHHAKLVEEEVVTLWADYFKPPHFEKYPELHELVWKTIGLCSASKQQVNMQAGQDLLTSTQRIAEIFWESKGVATRRQPSNQPAGGELVYPVA